MLTPADTALVRRDPTLRGLATVLDPEAVLGRSQAPTGCPLVLGASPTYVRYKPGTSCVVGYRLATEAGPVLAYAKAHHPRDEAKLRKAEKKAASDTDLGWGVSTHLAETIFVAAASSDRDLPALAALADEGRRERLLRRLLPDEPDLWTEQPRAIRHKPERRWLGLVERDGEPVALIKAYRAGEVRSARAGQMALAGPAVPPLGCSHRSAALASTWVPGVNLRDALASADPVDVAAVGAALARLHALQPDRRLPRIDGDDGWSAAVEAAEAVAVLVPALGKRACRLAHRLGRALAALPPAARVVHGDFSADQVVLTDNGVAVIDFDAAAVADPALDLGSFAADLDRAELEHRLPVGRAATAAAELVDGYHRAGGAPVDHGVAAHRAAALLRLAVLPFRERQPEWPVAIEAILAGAEAVAAGSR